jgi:hypothetical protein
MIIRFNPKAMLVLAGSFLAGALAIGIPYFALEYSQVNLPSSLFGWGLFLLLALAAFIRISSSAGFLSTAAVMALVAPAVVMARVVVDTARDPTSHNLWPLEVVIAGFVGLCVAAAGATAGSLVRWATRRQRKSLTP